MSTQWYLTIKGKQHGPFGSTDLKKLVDAGSIGPDTLVHTPEHPMPVPARKFNGLFPEPPKPDDSDSMVGDMLGQSSPSVSERWHVDIEGQQHGPFTWAELKQLADKGEIGRITLVYTSENPKRILAHKVEGLFPDLPTSGRTPIDDLLEKNRDDIITRVVRGDRLKVIARSYHCLTSTIKRFLDTPVKKEKTTGVVVSASSVRGRTGREMPKSKVECVKCGQLTSRKYAYYRWGLCPKCVEGKENLKTAVGLIGVGGLCVLALIMVVWYFSTVDSSHESTDYETLRKERLIREEKGRLEKERMEQREAIERAIIREKLRREGY